MKNFDYDSYDKCFREMKQRRRSIILDITLNPTARTDAVASLKRYFEANMPEPIGDLAAGLLLGFILEEIGPAIYNQAIADAQTRLQQRVADLSGELYADEFPYWPKQQNKKRR